MQKKWAELFEKWSVVQTVTRRVYGWESSFDLKQIQPIAGNAPEENLSPVEEPVLETKLKKWRMSIYFKISSGFYCNIWRNLWRKPSAEELPPLKARIWVL